MAANRQIVYHLDNDLIIGDWSGSVSFPDVVLFQDGTKSAPTISFVNDTNTGFYRIANETIGVAVGGASFVKMQGGPNRFLIGTDAENITADTTFHVEDPDAGIRLDRTHASESFIGVLTNTTGGGQLRGLIAGGVRLVESNQSTVVRCDESELSCAVGTDTASATLTVQQKTNSALDVARFRDEGGFNFVFEEGGNVLLGVTDAAVTTGSAAELHMGGGNSGTTDTKASLALGLTTGGTYANFIASYHNATVAALNGIRIFTNNAVENPTFASDANIGFSLFGQRAAVGIALPDAVFSVTGSVDPVADLNDPTDYQLYLHHKADTNNAGSGIAFSVDASDGFVGAAIIHKRIDNGSYGQLQFYTQQTIATNPDPILVLTLGEDKATTTHGGVRINFTEVTASTYAVLATDHYISVQYTDTGAHTATLPAISATNHGQIYYIKDADYNASTNNITIAKTGADTIDEAASKVISTDGGCVTVIANNTKKNWEVI